MNTVKKYAHANAVPIRTLGGLVRVWNSISAQRRSDLDEPQKVRIQPTPRCIGRELTLRLWYVCFPILCQ